MGESKLWSGLWATKQWAAAVSVERWMGLLLCTTIHQHWTTATTTTAAAAESSRQQAAAAAAATGAGWGGGWQLLEHATRFWRIDKTSASDRETTHTHTMRVRAIHTHTHNLLFIHLCVWWPVWNCCCCKRFYANYKIHRPGMLVFSLSLIVSLSRWNVCCFCVACIKGNPIDIYVDA